MGDDAICQGPPLLPLQASSLEGRRRAIEDFGKPGQVGPSLLRQGRRGRSPFCPLPISHPSVASTSSLLPPSLPLCCYVPDHLPPSLPGPLCPPPIPASAPALWAVLPIHAQGTPPPPVRVRRSLFSTPPGQLSLRRPTRLSPCLSVCMSPAHRCGPCATVFYLVSASFQDLLPV